MAWSARGTSLLRRPTERTERYAFACERCPRLRDALAADRAANPSHVARPIGARGSARARLLVVGLAPGRKGANRTGLVFAGDSSGSVLFTALANSGFASGSDPYQATLHNARLTNAVKCWPPGNSPEPEERAECASFLRDELAALWQPRYRQPRAILCLGRFAFDAVLRSGGLPSIEQPLSFGHGRTYPLRPTLQLTCSYHPSRQNMNTGRLTQSALNKVFNDLARLLN